MPEFPAGLDPRLASVLSGLESAPDAPEQDDLSGLDPRLKAHLDGLNAPEEQPSAIARSLGLVGSVLGAPKAGLDWVGRKVAEAQGIPQAEGTTLGQMFRAAPLGSWAPGLSAGEAPGYVGRLAGKALEFGADLATDPLTWVAGAAGKAAPVTSRIAQAALAGQMGLGAVQEGRQTIDTIRREGFTPQAAEETFGTLLSAGGAAMAAHHGIAEQGRASAADDLWRDRSQIAGPKPSLVQAAEEAAAQADLGTLAANSPRVPVQPMDPLVLEVLKRDSAGRLADETLARGLPSERQAREDADRSFREEEMARSADEQARAVSMAREQARVRAPLPEPPPAILGPDGKVANRPFAPSDPGVLERLRAANRAEATLPDVPGMARADPHVLDTLRRANTAPEVWQGETPSEFVESAVLRHPEEVRADLMAEAERQRVQEEQAAPPPHDPTEAPRPPSIWDQLTEQEQVALAHMANGERNARGHANAFKSLEEAQRFIAPRLKPKTQAPPSSAPAAVAAGEATPPPARPAPDPVPFDVPGAEPLKATFGTDPGERSEYVDAVLKVARKFGTTEGPGDHIDPVDGSRWLVHAKGGEPVAAARIKDNVVSDWAGREEGHGALVARRLMRLPPEETMIDPERLSPQSAAELNDALARGGRVGAAVRARLIDRGEPGADIGGRDAQAAADSVSRPGVELARGQAPGVQLPERAGGAEPGGDPAAEGGVRPAGGGREGPGELGKVKLQTRSPREEHPDDAVIREAARESDRTDRKVEGSSSLKGLTQRDTPLRSEIGRAERRDMDARVTEHAGDDPFGPNTAAEDWPGLTPSDRARAVKLDTGLNRFDRRLKPEAAARYRAELEALREKARRANTSRVGEAREQLGTFQAMVDDVQRRQGDYAFRARRYLDLPQEARTEEQRTALAAEGRSLLEAKRARAEGGLAFDSRGSRYDRTGAVERIRAAESKAHRAGEHTVAATTPEMEPTARELAARPDVIAHLDRAVRALGRAIGVNAKLLGLTTEGAVQGHQTNAGIRGNALAWYEAATEHVRQFQPKLTKAYERAVVLTREGTPRERAAATNAYHAAIAKEMARRAARTLGHEVAHYAVEDHGPEHYAKQRAIIRRVDGRMDAVRQSLTRAFLSAGKDGRRYVDLMAEHLTGAQDHWRGLPRERSAGDVRGAGGAEPVAGGREGRAPSADARGAGGARPPGGVPAGGERGGREVPARPDVGGGTANPVEPPVPQGHVRLYRGGTAKTAGRWFTFSRDVAEQFAWEHGEQHRRRPLVSYVDVPEALADEFSRHPKVLDEGDAGIRHEKAVYVPRDVASRAQDLSVFSRSTGGWEQPMPRPDVGAVRAAERRPGFGSLTELREHFKARGVDSFVGEHGDVLTLSRVVVPKAERGRGAGTEFMRALTEYADAHGKTLALTPSTDFGGSSVTRLAEFYKRFGFKSNRGRGQDFRISESMVREPSGGGEPNLQSRSPIRPIPPGAKPAAASAQPFQLPEESLADKVARTFQDETRRLEVVEKAVKSQGGTDRRIHDAFAAVRSKTSSAQQVIIDDFVEPLSKELAEKQIPLRDLDDYLSLLHKPARDKVIAARSGGAVTEGSGWTKADADARWTELEQAHGARSKGKLAALESMAQRLRDLREAGLKAAVDGELLSPEQVKSIKATWGDDYVPQRTFEVEDGVESLAGGPGFNVKGKEYKAAHGRESHADSPVSFMINQVLRTIVRAEKNKADINFADWVKENGLFPEDVDHTTHGFDTKGQSVTRPDPLRAQKDFTYKRNGVTHRIDIASVDPLTDRALRNMSAKEMDGFVGHLGDLTRRFSRMVTSYTPSFLFRNFTRDVQAASLNTLGEKGGKVAGKVVAGLPEAMRAMYQHAKNPLAGSPLVQMVREFKEDGGAVGWSQLKSASTIEKELNAKIHEAGPGAWNAFKRTARSAFSEVERVNGSVENATRFAVYKALRDSGASRADAGKYARNVSVDFTKRGEAGPVLNAAYAFFNANVQGVKRLKEVAVDNPRGRAVAASVAAVGLAMDMFNRGQSGDDDGNGKNDYDDIQEYVKQRSFIIMRGKGQKPLMFPMPYGFNVFHSLGRQIGAAMSGTVTPAAAAFNTAGSLYNAFNPLGGESGFVQTITPTVLDPFVQHATNETWTGRPLVPTAFPGQHKPDSERYYPNVSPTAIAIAKFLNDHTGGDEVTPGYISWSPEVIAHYADAANSYLTGGAGREALELGQAAATIASGGTPSIRNIPLAKSFVYEESPSASGQTYRANRDDLDELMDRYTAYRKAGEPSKVRDLPMPLLRVKRQVDAIDRQIQALRRAGSAARDGEERVKALQTKANRLVAQARKAAGLPVNS